MYEKDYLTVSELAEIIGSSESFVRKLVFRNQIPYIKIGKLVRFRPIDVTRWIDEQQTKEEVAL
jgi:excisionase family DNA binding protein